MTAALFNKILIANRGEIACRVIRTAKRLGIGTVAVYSDADREALHVKMADEAVRIGPAPSRQSYLSVEAILAAVATSGAEAVHPGYGFLSENAVFAAALERAGVAFVGPPVRAIEAMGDKITSKRLAAEAGVSTVPGHMGLVEDADEAARIAARIGYPVMIKASAGGGGKGMRIAATDAEAREGFRASQAEARNAFGDDRLFIEKFITEPRHIEIQILGDRHGTLLHLGERECSIQRRNQKVVEEAPSPFLDAATRAAMGAQAVALGQAVGYFSAGTVEFIVDRDRNFYFLEMNTRLQVEHPVTELVTGLDLVEAMIRVAAGEPLGLTQDEVRLDGWAVESRLYAEDPFRNFLPSTGRLTRYRPPTEGRQPDGSVVRNDAGVAEGGEISVHYDPMIAKLCTWAPDRAGAVDAMSLALDEFELEGVGNNLPFLAALMTHPRFRDGRLSTAFIAEEYPDGFAGVTPAPDALRLLAAVAAFVHHRTQSRDVQISGALDNHRRTVGVDWVVTLGGQAFAVTLKPADQAPSEQHAIPSLMLRSPRSGRLEAWAKAEAPAHPSTRPLPRPAQDEGVNLVGQALTIALEDETDISVASAWTPGRSMASFMIDGEIAVIKIGRAGSGYRLRWRGIDLVATARSPSVAALARLMPEKLPPDTSKLLLCPMPGIVTAITVAVGDMVEAGQALATVEAMKMENVLRAGRRGTVARVAVAPGASLAVDAVILEFE